MSEQFYVNESQASDLMKYISDNMKIPVLGAGGGFAPIGVGNWYFGSVAPQGWLICDGTTYNIADYPDLATFFASNYESSNAFGGDGVTTFAVPDLRGEFIRMIGANSHTGQGDGAGVGVHQDATEINDCYTNTNTNFLNGLTHTTNPDNYREEAGKYAGNTSSKNSQWPAERVTTRPTNTSLNFIIKATVSGDDKSHQYSTEEQVVGMTEDGEVLYEKTITGLSLSATWAEQYEARATTTLSSLGLSNIKDIYYSSCFSVSGNTKRYETPSIMIGSGNLTIGIHTTATINKLIIQYTKTS